MPHPTDIKLRTKSRTLDVAFDDGQRFELSWEYLRVYSPSAEVRGHGSGPHILVTGKEDVVIKEVEPVGNYAVRLKFDDGHDTGLYSWPVLYELGTLQETNWRDYLRRLESAGVSRRKPD